LAALADHRNGVLADHRAIFVDRVIVALQFVRPVGVREWARHATQREAIVAALRNRIGVIILLGAVMTISACQSSTSPTADRPASPGPTVVPSSEAGGTGGAGQTGAPETTPSTQQDLRFPNTTLAVQLVGYDGSLQMVEFRKVVGEKTDDGTGHLSTSYFEPDPTDRATHRLPLAPGADITATGAEICPPQHCTAEMAITNLLSHEGQPCAVIRVDGSGRIDQVNEVIQGMGGDAAPPQDI
jgi:hypothetical protein